MSSASPISEPPTPPSDISRCFSCINLQHAWLILRETQFLQDVQELVLNIFRHSSNNYENNKTIKTNFNSNNRKK